MTSQHGPLRGISVAGTIVYGYSTILRFFSGTQPVPLVILVTQAQPLSTRSILTISPSITDTSRATYLCWATAASPSIMTPFLGTQPRFPFWLSQNTHPGHSSSLLVTIFSLSPASITNGSGYFVS